VEPYLSFELLKRAIPWEGQFMAKISSTTKAYIAGFLDGDGCIMFQLVRRKDYVYGFQIRASIVFYQKTINRRQLEWLKSMLEYGYIRDRKDAMTEYIIVGFKSVMKVLKFLRPYIILKHEHVNTAFIIDRIMNGKFTIEKMVKAARFVDKYQQLNYSKKRTNTAEILEKFLKEHKLYPCND